MAKTKIVEGLFGPTPEAIEKQRNLLLQQQSALFSKQGGYQSLGGNLGLAIGKGLGSVFGNEDPTLTKAKNIRQIMQDAQSETEEGASPIDLYENLYNKLSEAGYAEESILALEKRQQFKDKEITFDLARQQIAATQEKTNDVVQQKEVAFYNKQADQEIKLNNRNYKIITADYDDPESSLYKEAEQFAGTLDGEGGNPSVRNTYMSLHKKLHNLTYTDAFGNLRPVFSPGNASSYAKKILSEKNEDGKYKYIKSGNYNPFAKTKSGVPEEAFTKIKNEIYGQLSQGNISISEKSEEPTLKGLNDRDEAAYAQALQDLKTDPTDKAALETVRMLKNRYAPKN